MSTAIQCTEVMVQNNSLLFIIGKSTPMLNVLQLVGRDQILNLPNLDNSKKKKNQSMTTRCVKGA